MEIRQSLLLDWARRLNNSGTGSTLHTTLRIADEIAREAVKEIIPLRKECQLDNNHEG